MTGERRVPDTPDAADRYYEMYDDIVARNWPVPCDEIDVPGRFGTTRVRRSGAKRRKPIVLLHPTAGSSADSAPPGDCSGLSERHPVYTPDTIGTAGRSIQTEPIGSARDLGMWLDDVLAGLGLDGIHLVGYSEGGWIAGVHAAHTPNTDRLATLTLIEPGGAIGTRTQAVGSRRHHDSGRRRHPEGKETSARLFGTSITG